MGAREARMPTLSRFEAWMLRLAGSVLSRRGAAASVIVLIYHRVLAATDPLLPDEPDAAAFDAQMALIARNFNVLPLREAVERLRSGSLPARAVCITFDDGYANNCEIALPILSRRRVPATVFVAPGYLNGKRMFNDTVLEAVRRARADASPPTLAGADLTSTRGRIEAWERIVTSWKYLDPGERLARAEALAMEVGAALPTDIMMTDEQVRRLHRAGIEIGAHTMSHPILTRIDPGASFQEMTESRRRLEEIIGSRVTSFAYPNGRPIKDYDRTHVALAGQAGFALAVTTAWGAATMGSDRLQIPRIAPWDRSALRYGARLVASYRDRSFQTV